MADRQLPTQEEVMSYLRERRNWGRWGDKGSAGAMNLITEGKRLKAAQLVSKGRTVSLSRPFPVTPSAENPRPAQHYMSVWERPNNCGAAVDFYGILYHGTSTTHIDALCHVWDEAGMWDGRKPSETLSFDGATGPPIWLGSWGSPAGLRRVARLGDGWLASAYNTTPEMFQEGRARLDGYLGDAGKDAGVFPDAIATMFCFVTEDPGEADRVIRDVIAPAINRPEEELGERLPVGSAEECAEKLSAYKAAGAQRIYLWPVEDEVRQLELFQERVIPLVA